MIEDVPMLTINLRIYKFWNYFITVTWRRFLLATIALLFNLSQIADIFLTDAPGSVLILNAYGFALWFNTNLRNYYLITKRVLFEELMENLEIFYLEIQTTNDPIVLKMLNKISQVAVKLCKINLIAGTATTVGMILFPFFVDHRTLPYGTYVFGLDRYATPYYEIIYIFQLIVSIYGCSIFMPMSNIIVSIMMIAILMCNILQYRLRNLSESRDTDKILMEKIISCIIYQQKIIKFIDDLNSVTSYLFLIEFLTYGILLCILLFLFIVTDDIVQSCFVVIYIFMILAQMAAFSWYANELHDQSLNVAIAAYETNWFNYKRPIQKAICMLIMRAQTPISVKVGNVYEMNMEMFQSVLNTTYSIFTLMKRIY